MWWIKGGEKYSNVHVQRQNYLLPTKPRHFMKWSSKKWLIGLWLGANWKILLSSLIHRSFNFPLWKNAFGFITYCKMLSKIHRWTNLAAWNLRQRWVQAIRWCNSSRCWFIMEGEKVLTNFSDMKQQHFKTELKLTTYISACHNFFSISVFHCQWFM
jgi:hypothetical protein